MSSGVGMLLLAAVAGYWVLERADRHKGQLKRIGQVVGGIVIVVSLIGVTCRVFCLVTGKTAFCPLDKAGKGWYCPFSSKSPPGSPTAQNPSE